jgi:hypothetical protein
MTAIGRVLMVMVVGAGLLTAATVATAAAAIYSSGTIAVQVEEGRGHQYSVRIPAVIANLALSLIPGRLVDEALYDVSADIQPYVPAVRDAWSELNATGDFVLVEVNNGGGGSDHVRIEKRGDNLLISVDSDDADIEVAVPIKTIGKVIHKL